MMLENVHDATSVNCRRNRCGLTSIWTAPPSPTKHIVPHTLVLRIAFNRASGLLDVSSVRFRQRHQCVGGYLQILRVATMGVVAIDLDRHLLAELLPAG